MCFLRFPYMMVRTTMMTSFFLILKMWRMKNEQEPGKILMSDARKFKIKILSLSSIGVSCLKHAFRDPI